MSTPKTKLKVRVNPESKPTIEFSEKKIIPIRKISQKDLEEAMKARQMLDDQRYFDTGVQFYGYSVMLKVDQVPLLGRKSVGEIMSKRYKEYYDDLKKDSMELYSFLRVGLFTKIKKILK